MKRIREGAINMQVLQVKRYNNLMLLQKQYQMVMTLGNGSMVDEPRSNGWVLYEPSTMAKWFKNKYEALDYSKLLTFTRENIPQ